jgi:serine O-acetyltransferase
VILTRADLRRFLEIEKNKIGVKNILYQRITYSEVYCTYNFFRNLRFLEYYKSKNKKWYHYIPYIWYLWNHRRLKLKYNFYIEPNCLGEGFLLVHPGFVRIGKDVTMGKNCTVTPLVLIGKKAPNQEVKKTLIGDNCYIGTGAKILGPVKIGNNVKIAAGSVVTSDIPDNCTVGGIPAKIINRHKV